jgi:hypothetical protein
MDWWAGITVGFLKYWKVSVQYLEFNFPANIPTAQNMVVSLGYDDAWWGWPITLNPYVNLFYNIQGGSTVVLGKTESTYRVEIGMRPTVNLQKSTGIPLTLTFPTWITVGPSSYWNRNDGTTNFCGITSNLPCSSGSAGVISTGILAKYSLESLIPKQYGSWYVRAGVQYYHILNDTLLGAQVAIASSPSFPTAERDVVVGVVGLGFSF